MTVLTLTQPAPGPVPSNEVVEMLRALLADAESGTLQQFAYAAIDADNTAHTGYEGLSIRLLGAAARLQFRLNEVLV